MPLTRNGQLARDAYVGMACSVPLPKWRESDQIGSDSSVVLDPGLCSALQSASTHTASLWNECPYSEAGRQRGCEIFSKTESPVGRWGLHSSRTPTPPCPWVLGAVVTMHSGHFLPRVIQSSRLSTRVGFTEGKAKQSRRVASLNSRVRYMPLRAGNWT